MCFFKPKGVRTVTFFKYNLLFVKVSIHNVTILVSCNWDNIKEEKLKIKRHKKIIYIIGFKNTDKTIINR